MTNETMNHWQVGAILVVGFALASAFVSAAYSATKDAFPKPLALLMAVAIVASGIAACIGIVWLVGTLGVAVGLGGAR